MKAIKWIWKGWLLAMALVAFLATACTVEDGVNDYYKANYTLRDSTLTGHFDGEWNAQARGFSVYLASNASSFDNEKHLTGIIVEELQQRDIITLTADSIQLNSFGYSVMTRMLVYHMYGQALGDMENWPLELFGEEEHRPYKSRLTRLGYTSDSVYLMADKTTYSFTAHIGDMKFTILATMAVPGSCVINYATRTIVVDFNIEKLRAEGLEPGRIGSLGSEFEVTFSLPELLRFTAQF